MTTERGTGALMWTTDWAPVTGKGAARYFDHLDIDGDGSDEVVLEVMGERSMWLSTLSRRGGVWVEEYRDPCGLASMSSGPAR